MHIWLLNTATALVYLCALCHATEAAGGVGFGCLDMGPQEEDEEQQQQSQQGGEGAASPRKRKKKRGKRLLSVEDVAIPPIIRHLHPRLNLQAYKRCVRVCVSMCICMRVSAPLAHPF
jgi:hypothetical protein